DEKNLVAQGGGPGKGAGFGGKGKGGPSPIRDIMAKLTRGPQSLGNRIGDELKTDLPPWDELQSQTKEYVRLASSLTSHDPPKGSKESWTQLTASFSDSATTLDRSVQS